MGEKIEADEAKLINKPFEFSFHSLVIDSSVNKKDGISSIKDLLTFFITSLQEGNVKLLLL